MKCLFNINILVTSSFHSIEEMRECNISWSGTKSIASFSENLDNFGLPIRKNDFTKELPNNTEARCVQIRMSVFDSRLCKGPEVSVIVHLSAILPPRVVHYDVRTLREPWNRSLPQLPKYFISDNFPINFNLPGGRFHNSCRHCRCLCVFLEDAEEECRKLLARGLSQRTEWVSEP